MPWLARRKKKASVLSEEGGGTELGKLGQCSIHSQLLRHAVFFVLINKLFEGTDDSTKSKKSVMKQQSKRHFSGPLPLPLVCFTAQLNTIPALWDLALPGTTKIFCTLTYSYSSYPNNKSKDYIQSKSINRVAPLINMGMALNWFEEKVPIYLKIKGS